MDVIVAGVVSVLVCRAVCLSGPVNGTGQSVAMCWSVGRSDLVGWSCLVYGRTGPFWQEPCRGSRS